MKSTTHHFITILASLTTAGALTIPASAADRSLAEFGKKETEELGWRIVNDGVMGGRSKGTLTTTDSGSLIFKGNLSLENNGGFSSLRTSSLDLDLSESSGLVMRVKGDGRTYQVRLGSDARYRGMEVSFMADFPTEAGQWTEVRVPFANLTGTFHGRTLKNETFNPAEVRRLGLLLADKKAGPFNLEVDWVRAYAGETSNTIVDLAVADGRFKTLATALQKADLANLLQGDGPFTVFAPTDSAFAQLPTGTVARLLEPENLAELQAILKYHVSPGSTKLAGALKAGTATTAQGESVTIAFAKGDVRVNGAAILDADIEGSNGVIHVIDSVLLPPAPEKTNDILGVAKAAGTFNTLIAAVEAAGLTSTLQSEGPFTILAPTDKAFEALPDGTVQTLLKPENVDKLKAILTYHAFSGKVSAGDALNAGTAKTLSGQPVEFSIKDGAFQVNGATIRSTDIACDNGVIHVIDAVLLPKSECSQSECEQAEASTHPKQLIENAIDRGVPVFNGGDHAGCAAIYKDTLQTLAGNTSMTAEVRQRLQKVVDYADSSDCNTTRAWIYRKALDHTYNHVTNKL